MSALTMRKLAPAESSLPTLRTEMNRLIEDALRTPAWSPTNVWSGANVAPPMDVVETAETFVVTAEVAGLAPDEIDVQVEGTSLTLRGVKRPPSDEEGQALRRERTHGSFCRTVTLPGSIEAGDVSASYELGLLTITVPKAEIARARRIEVRQAD